MIRDVFISYSSDGTWHLALREAQVIKVQRMVTNYHEIGSIVSNWILHGIAA